jgi:hypothetical protein
MHTETGSCHLGYGRGETGLNERKIEVRANKPS